MLDIKDILANIDAVKDSIRRRCVNVDLDRLLSIYYERKNIQKLLEEKRAYANLLAKQFAHIQYKNKDKHEDNINCNTDHYNQANNSVDDQSKRLAMSKEEIISTGKQINQEIKQMEDQLVTINEEFTELIMQVPNFLADDTPYGTSDTDNVVLKYHGRPGELSDIFANQVKLMDNDVVHELNLDSKPNNLKSNLQLDDSKSNNLQLANNKSNYLKENSPDYLKQCTAFKDHVTIGKQLDLIDFDSGSKTTGSKFYFLKNQLVLVEIALKLFAIKIANSYGFKSLITPDLAKKAVLNGTGFSPRGEESNIYTLEGMDLGLIATSEIAVCGMHADEIFNFNQLPLKYVAYSHCYRREAGSGGRESRGLYRVHQFSKVELFQFTTENTSANALEEILAVEETIYQQLNLPYRVVRICDADLGSSAYKKYDIEVWMPGKESNDKYGEVTSASNCTDYQARRLNIKYKDQNGNRRYMHTLNGTALASSRTIMAILENYYQLDGSVVIPSVLVDYLGFDRISLV